MKRIVCFHSDVDVGVTTHLDPRALLRIVGLMVDGQDLPAQLAVLGVVSRGEYGWGVSSRDGSRWKSVGVMEELNNNSVCS